MPKNIISPDHNNEEYQVEKQILVTNESVPFYIPAENSEEVIVIDRLTRQVNFQLLLLTHSFVI